MIPHAQRVVLVVENAPAAATSLARFFRAAGLPVISAGSLSAARERAAWVDVVFAVIESSLPDGPGRDLMSELNRGRGIRGAEVGGPDSDGQLVGAHQAGFAFHLSRPVLDAHISQVVAAARQALEVQVPSGPH
jgi:DNA-binding response OmpR family regulator